MKKHTRLVPLESIIVVAEGESFRNVDEPPHRIGDIVRLNSGGPPSLVLDLDCEQITIGWRDGSGVLCEDTLPDICVHRVRDLF